MTPQEKFATTRRELSTALIERDQEIDLILTALIAREHALLVGPPGTAKSMLAAALVQWLDGRKFEILLTKFSTPEEVFGPISLVGLKADHYRRITTDRLPEAEIAFVDEVWKASSAILNTLLTVLNERLFDNDGTRVPCPLQLCIAASNEWPGENGDSGKELGALFDRFVLRRQVRPIATERGRQRLLWDPIDTTLSTHLSATEITAAHWQATELSWSEEAHTALLAIVKEAQAEGIIPGDRRLRKSITVARAYAWLQGHTLVEKEDLEILAAVLWDDPTEQPAKLATIVGRIANPEGMKVNTLLVEAEQIIARTETKDLAACATACKKLGEIHGKLGKIDTARATQGAEHIAAEVKRLRIATVEAL